jgi:mannose-6-phosphate isomerase class I
VYEFFQAPFFLNYLLIAPGESFFMAANEPHAYVAGEIIECMACSDNVVRAGLTPKFKDVETLVQMLTYTTGGPSIDAGAPLNGDPRILRYTPPVPEFEVLMVQCDPGDAITVKISNVPAVFVIIEGTGTLGTDLICRPGKCYYRNLHLEVPTTFSRLTPHPSLEGSYHSSPRGSSSPSMLRDLSLSVNGEYISIPDWSHLS